MLGPTPYGSLHNISHEVVSTAAGAKGKAETAVNQVRRIEDRLDRLVLVNMALWELLKERTGLTEDELAAKVEQIDLADGKADGKVGKVILECAECGRKVNSRHGKCLYCGHELPGRGAFDKV